MATDHSGRASAAPDDTESGLAVRVLGPLDVSRDGRQQQPTVGRYRFHDLVRLYAAELSAAEEGPSTSRAAVTRVLDWLVGSLRNAVATVRPTQAPSLSYLPAPVADEPLQVSEATILLNLGACHFTLEQYDEAVRYTDDALACARKLGDSLMEGLSLSNLAEIHEHRGDDAQAAVYCTQALEHSEQHMSAQVEFEALKSRGRIFARAGNFVGARAAWEKALRLAHDPAAPLHIEIRELIRTRPGDDTEIGRP